MINNKFKGKSDCSHVVIVDNNKDEAERIRHLKALKREEEQRESYRVRGSRRAFSQ